MMVVEEGLTIIVRADDSDEHRLAACLKTLEVNPPCVSCDVIVLAPDPSPRLDAMLADSSSIRLVTHNDSHCAAMNMIVRGSSRRWALFLHPDTLLVSSQWSDSCLSRLVGSGLAAMGVQPFETFEGAGGKASCVGDWFLLVEKPHFEAVGGFPEALGLHGGAFVLQMRMMSRAMTVAGADLDGIAAHMRSCAKERSKPTEAEVEIVRAIAEREFPVTG